MGGCRRPPTEAAGESTAALRRDCLHRRDDLPRMVWRPRLSCNELGAPISFQVATPRSSRDRALQD
eukprot:7560541-Pyramimonas_sp.AAC.1